MGSRASRYYLCRSVFPSHRNRQWLVLVLDGWFTVEHFLDGWFIVWCSGLEALFTLNFVYTSAPQLETNFLRAKGKLVFL